MENSPEGGSPSRIGKIRRSVKGVLDHGWDVYRGVVERIGWIAEKIPAEQINEHTVAKTIVGSFWGEQMSFGDKTGVHISAADILANMGHVATLNTDDYRQKHPAEYEVLRRSLDNLVQAGVLEREFLEQPDMHHETIYYRVANKEALRQLAQDPQMGLPAKP